MGEAIVVTSGKGGVGKTTTSANVGAALAILGKQVCLVDTDIGLRNLDVALGLENRIIYDLLDVADGNCKLKQALIKDKRFDSLFLLAASQTKDKNALEEDRMKEIISQLKEEFDYVIIDCPAGIEKGFQNAIVAADRAIIVATPDAAAVRDADRVIGLLEKASMKRIDLIVNRANSKLMSEKDMLDIDEVVSILSIQLLGVVPDDENILRANNKGEPVAMLTEPLASKAYRNIARRILGETVPLLDVRQSKGGFFKKIKSIFS
ncbi:septum site-determining protein MinD [Desulfuribacillus stibiiarsenatis]|uniref:Septum site-determining protein MinD n=1 Tax=Desulfuribacillus stibiiarsenatis TaxID=1390249 RepID=A0A1E5L259_9FIRM|nr:septum site-determining protein MinD [Desulfuribacillus stibiiarsenatis]OEH84238.1 septum site-determining protein MinD [Desulfuribacillus stibiiarsenatis]